MKNNWKKYGIIVIILVVAFGVVRNKYFYTTLFSQDFCNSIVEVQYVTHENEVYPITDEKLVREFADALCENKYKKLSEINEGGVTFKLLTDEGEYVISMSASDIQWEEKAYKPKVEFFEILAKVWENLGME